MDLVTVAAQKAVNPEQALKALKDALGSAITYSAKLPEFIKSQCILDANLNGRHMDI